MFEAWTYSQTFRAIGQHLEEINVQDFLLEWQDDEFVLRGLRKAPLKPRWIDRLIGRVVAHTKRVEIHYKLKDVLWLDISGQGLRKNPDQIPDYYRLSQTLRTVGRIADHRTMPLLSLQREGGTLYFKFQERTGHVRIEKQDIGSLENYFLRTYLRRIKNPPGSPDLLR